MTRKLIAFALSFILTLCGLATAQNQQSWGSMALMRAGVRAGGPWIDTTKPALLLTFDGATGNENYGALGLTNVPVGATRQIIGTNRNGRLEYGLCFSNNTQYAWVGGTASNSWWGGTAKRSISYWIMFPSGESTTTYMHWSFKNGGAWGDESFYGASKRWIGPNTTISWTSPAIVSNTWILISARLSTNNYGLDGTNSFIVYTNSVLATNLNIANSPTHTGALYFMRREGGSFAQAQKCFIDDVRFYTNDLTPAQISDLFSYTHPTNNTMYKEE